MRRQRTLLPDDFSVTDAMKAWADVRIPQIDLDVEHEKFCNFWRARDRTMKDWVATWRVWMLRAPQMGGAMKKRTEILKGDPRWPSLLVRAAKVGFRKPYEADIPDTYETALRHFERERPCVGSSAK